MKKRYLIIPLLTLLLTSNVYAITSNDVTYDNNGTTENLTTTLDTLYGELKKYKTTGSVEASQMLEGATGYSKGVLVTGTIKSKGSTTYTPGTSNQTIAAGQYLSGTQTIKGDANLTAANIAKGKSIFGVSGTYTSDANATAEHILESETAYVNGSKVTGTMTNNADQVVSVTTKSLLGDTTRISVPAGYYNNNSKIQIANSTIMNSLALLDIRNVTAEAGGSLTITYDLAPGRYYMIIPVSTSVHIGAGYSGPDATSLTLSGATIIKGQESAQRAVATDVGSVLLQSGAAVIRADSSSVTVNYNMAHTQYAYGGMMILYRIY